MFSLLISNESFTSQVHYIFYSFPISDNEQSDPGKVFMGTGQEWLWVKITIEVGAYYSESRRSIFQRQFHTFIHNEV